MSLLKYLNRNLLKEANIKDDLNGLGPNIKYRADLVADKTIAK